VEGGVLYERKRCRAIVANAKQGKRKKGKLLSRSDSKMNAGEKGISRWRGGVSVDQQWRSFSFFFLSTSVVDVRGMELTKKAVTARSDLCGGSRGLITYLKQQNLRKRTLSPFLS
jgi:hypothetical protein